jgi:transcriptional regulator with XRE-family HTH domain
VVEKSQSAVARESGFALLTIQRYLNGIGESTLGNLRKLADYFDVFVPWLRGDDPREYEEAKKSSMMAVIGPPFNGSFTIRTNSSCGVPAHW